jgi:hypothetical protein
MLSGYEKKKKIFMGFLNSKSEVKKSRININMIYLKAVLDLTHLWTGLVLPGKTKSLKTKWSIVQ